MHMIFKGLRLTKKIYSFKDRGDIKPREHLDEEGKPLIEGEGVKGGHAVPV